MSSDCNILNPLQRDGTSQRQRLVDTLRPSYVSVDERDLSDHLIYAYEYAKLLRYYSVDNAPQGDWQIFLERDISVVVSRAAGVEFRTWRRAFRDRRRVLEASSGADREAALSALFDLLENLVREFIVWYDQSIEGLLLHRRLHEMICGSLTDALRQFREAARQARAAGISVPDVERLQFSAACQANGHSRMPRLFASGINDEEIDRAADYLDRIFQIFYEALVQVVEDAPTFLRETVEAYPGHQPHLALFITFIQLLLRARDHLNAFTRRHLDFYYEDVLRLPHRPTVPDKAHVVFELSQNVDEHLVPADTFLKAGKDAGGRDLVYATDDELVVNRARVHPELGLRTVFVETNSASTAVNNIYAAPQADSADGRGADLESDDGKWETFGSSEMPYASVGFAIASPQFLLGAGEREIRLEFTFEDLISSLAALEGVPIFERVPDFFHRFRRSSGLSGSPFGFGPGENIPFAIGSESLPEWRAEHRLSRMRERIEAELQHNVEVYLSGAEEWIPAAVEDVAITGDTLTYTITLPADAPAVVPYASDVLEDGFTTRWPVLRLMLDNEGFSAADGFDLSRVDEIESYDPSNPEYAAGAYVRLEDEIYEALTVVSKGYYPDQHPEYWKRIRRSYPYRYFQALQLRRLAIGALVEGATNLRLENDLGVINASKPFQPFGPHPRRGSSFYIGSSEIFQKKIDGMQLTITWGDLPKESFSAHYAEYDTPSPVTNDSDFTSQIEVLRGGSWETVLWTDTSDLERRHDLREYPVETGDGWSSTVSVPLFDDNTTNDPPAGSRDLELGNVLPARDIGLEPFASFASSLSRGFLRFTLERDFFHREYPRALAEAVKPGGGDIPKEPYTPLITTFELAYSSWETIDFADATAADVADRAERLFHIHPFGHVEFDPVDEQPPGKVIASRKLVPEFTVQVPQNGHTVSQQAEGMLYIGLEQLEPPQNVSILFQVSEGSGDPVLEKPEVVWSYLSENRWINFETEEILSERTNGLLTSGIVTFAAPKRMTRGNTVLPGDLHWIRASAADHTAAVSKLIAVIPQAVRASFRDRGNDPAHVKRGLPAETIGKLKTRRAAVAGVHQPFASFGGRMEEQGSEFYTRVSERLRHKQRAITIFDYERLVLEQFPAVYKVQCINHTDDRSEHAPGHVKVIVVPDLRNKNAVDPLRPRVSVNTLEEITAYLDDLSTNFVAVEVQNPTYEQVEVTCDVKLREGRDRGFYTKQLNADIIKFLSPWLYEEGEDLSFGGSIHRSWILNFIEERDYVDYVTNFTIAHTTPAGVLRDVEEAAASTSSSVLVSASAHHIGNIS